MGAAGSQGSTPHGGGAASKKKDVPPISTDTPTSTEDLTESMDEESSDMVTPGVSTTSYLIETRMKRSKIETLQTLQSYVHSQLDQLEVMLDMYEAQIQGGGSDSGLTGGMRRSDSSRSLSSRGRRMSVSLSEAGSMDNLDDLFDAMLSTIQSTRIQLRRVNFVEPPQTGPDVGVSDPSEQPLDLDSARIRNRSIAMLRLLQPQNQETPTAKKAPPQPPSKDSKGIADASDMTVTVSVEKAAEKEVYPTEDMELSEEHTSHKVDEDLALAMAIQFEEQRSFQEQLQKEQKWAYAQIMRQVDSSQADDEAEGMEGHEGGSVGMVTGHSTAVTTDSRSAGESMSESTPTWVGTENLLSFDDLFGGSAAEGVSDAAPGMILPVPSSLSASATLSSLGPRSGPTSGVLDLIESADELPSDGTAAESITPIGPGPTAKTESSSKKTTTKSETEEDETILSQPSELDDLIFTKPGVSTPMGSSVPITPGFDPIIVQGTRTVRGSTEPPLPKKSAKGATVKKKEESEDDEESKPKQQERPQSTKVSKPPKIAASPSKSSSFFARSITKAKSFRFKKPKISKGASKVGAKTFDVSEESSSTVATSVAATATTSMVSESIPEDAVVLDDDEVTPGGPEEMSTKERMLLGFREASKGHRHTYISSSYDPFIYLGNLLADCVAPFLHRYEYFRLCGVNHHFNDTFMRLKFAKIKEFFYYYQFSSLKQSSYYINEWEDCVMLCDGSVARSVPGSSANPMSAIAMAGLVSTPSEMTLDAASAADPLSIMAAGSSHFRSSSRLLGLSSAPASSASSLASRLISIDDLYMLKFFVIYYELLVAQFEKYHESVSVLDFPLSLESVYICDNSSVCVSGPGISDYRINKKRLVKFVSDVLYSLTPLHRMDWFFIENNALNDLDFHHIVDCGLNRRYYANSLQLISFSRNPSISDKFIDYFFAVISDKCPQLEYILFDECRLSDKACHSLAEYYIRKHGATRLHYVSLNRNRRISRTGIDEIDSIIKRGYLPRRYYPLFTVCFSGCGFRRRDEEWDARIVTDAEKSAFKRFDRSDA